MLFVDCLEGLLLLDSLVCGLIGLRGAVRLHWCYGTLVAVWLLWISIWFGGLGLLCGVLFGFVVLTAWWVWCLISVGLVGYCVLYCLLCNCIFDVSGLNSVDLLLSIGAGGLGFVCYVGCVVGC